MVRAIKCCRYGLYKLFSRARPFSVLLVIFFFMQNELKPLKQFLMDYGERINGFGLFANRLSDIVFVLVTGMGLMIILGDAPFFDSAQREVLLRAGKMPWLIGQVMYIFAVTALYLAVLMLFQHFLLAPHIEYGRGWGRALHTLGQTSMGRDYAILFPFFDSLTNQWTVRRCFALAIGLRFTAWATAALVMFTGNLAHRMKIGVIAAVFILLLDIVIDTSLPYWVFILSPSSLARLSIMDLGINPYLPDVDIAMAVLFGSFLAAIILALAIGKKCDLIESEGGSA